MFNIDKSVNNLLRSADSDYSLLLFIIYDSDYSLVVWLCFAGVVASR